MPLPAKERDQKVLIVPSGPADLLETATLMFHQAINAATERIWITSPYFVPDHAIMAPFNSPGFEAWMCAF